MSYEPPVIRRVVLVPLRDPEVSAVRRYRLGFEPWAAEKDQPPAATPRGPRPVEG